MGCHCSSAGAASQPVAAPKGADKNWPSLLEAKQEARENGVPLKTPAIRADLQVASPDLQDNQEVTNLFSLVAPWLSPTDFLRNAVATAKAWSPQWYENHSGAVIVPDHAPSVNAAINTLAERKGTRLVLLRPGTYKEATRVVTPCSIFGWGRRERVVIEAPGWESPLVFVSGDGSAINNVTIRCRIQQMKGKCVYIPAGRPLLERCFIEGGVHACGSGSGPMIRACRIRNSPGCGFHFSDGCTGNICDCEVVSNKSHGILIERSAHPEIFGNRILQNGGCGIRALVGQACATSSQSADLRTPSWIHDNAISNNGSRDLSIDGGFVDEQDEKASEDKEMPAFDDLFAELAAETEVKDVGVEHDNPDVGTSGMSLKVRDYEPPTAGLVCGYQFRNFCAPSTAWSAQAA